MPITVQWHDVEQTILVESFNPGWAWEEFHAAADECVRLRLASPREVALIMDARTVGSPPDSNVIGHYRRVAARLAGQFELIVVILNGGFIQITGQIFAEVVQRGRHLVDFTRSMDEALAIIALRRSGRNKAD